MLAEKRLILEQKSFEIRQFVNKKERILLSIKSMDLLLENIQQQRIPVPQEEVHAIQDYRNQLESILFEREKLEISLMDQKNRKSIQEEIRNLEEILKVLQVNESLQST